METALRSVTDRIAAARADGTPLSLRGGGSKDFLGRAGGELLDTRALSGIISYEPTELVVTVGCGTPLSELEAALAEQGQYLPFEPPHFRWSGADSQATVGGMLGAGLSGPARATAGSVRDYVLGLKLINGLGEHLTFGGQVMKNVAGYDVSRLMAGARGRLGLITEVSLKVLPRAPAETTLLFALEQTEALEHLHRWGGQPLPMNASCWVMDDSVPGVPAKPSLFVRLRGAVAAVEAACRKMLQEVPGQRLDSVAADWELCRNQQLPFFTDAQPVGHVLWRLSVAQTAPVLALPGHPLVEWQGGLRWLWASVHAGPELQAAAQAAGGSAVVFHDPSGPANAHAAAPLDSATAAISRRLKASFDPQGIFNPESH